MKIKLYFLWLFQMGLSVMGKAQPIVAESFVGINHYKYQHMFMRPFLPQGRFGYFNSSSLQFFYDSKRQTEAMTQSYITYKLSPVFTAGAGTFYATGAGFRPSLALQVAQRKNDFFYLFFPRVDYQKSVSFELMTLMEYRPKITEGLHFYSRLNAMCNYGPHHNRSFQNVVVGIDWKNTQVGVGLTLDEWGEEIQMQRNWGILFKKEFL